MPFSSPEQTRVLRSLADVQDRIRDGLPIQIEVASGRRAKDGVVLRFSLRHPLFGWEVAGACRHSANGGLVIAELEIKAPADRFDGGVSAAMLRQVPLQVLQDEIQLRIQNDLAQREATRLLLGAPRESPYAEIGEPARPRRGGRPAIPDDVLREVALTYIAFSQDRKGRVLDRMAERFDRRPETLRDWVRAARKAQWLGPAKRGVAFGSRGPRLLAEDGQVPSPGRGQK